MNGNEFLRRVRRLCKKRKQAYKWHPELGKGSHGVLRIDNRFTVLRNLKDELTKGTLHGMLKQLGLKEEDLHNP